jgi:hypothetical protein
LNFELGVTVQVLRWLCSLSIGEANPAGSHDSVDGVYHGSWLLRAIGNTACAPSPHLPSWWWRPVHHETHQGMLSAFLMRNNSSCAFHETITSIGCRNSYLNMHFSVRDSACYLTWMDKLNLPTAS